MKAKVYLKMLACLVGLLTFYSCNNDLEQDKNASVAAQQVQNGQEVSLQENAYADYLELMKSTFYITNNEKKYIIDIRIFIKKMYISSILQKKWNNKNLLFFQKVIKILPVNQITLFIILVILMKLVIFMIKLWHTNYGKPKIKRISIYQV